VLYLKGEQKAFKELEERFHKRLLNYFRRHNVNDEDDRNDLLQETWAVAVKKINNGLYDFSKVFTAWIFRIAQNMVKRHFDKANPRTRTLHGLVEEFIEEQSEQHYKMDTQWQHALLQEAMQCLTPHEREVFEMHNVEGLSFEQIGEKLHCSSSTARNVNHHAREKMMHHLAGKGIHKGDI